MAAAAVSSSLVHRGWSSIRVLSAHSAVGGTSTGSKSLVWDPLHRRHAVLRSSRSAYLSSSSGLSTSFALSCKFSETQGSPRLRLAAPRASGMDEETEQMTKITKIESDDRLQSNVDRSSGSSNNMWSQFLTSFAKPAVVAVMMALLLAQPVENSFAASSGGRVGGKAFSSPRPSAPSRSYSGGGGGGGGGRAYSGGGGGGLYAAPPIYGSPYGFSPFGYSPFYGGGYGGGAFLGPSIGFGGGGTIILAMIAFATLRAVVGFIRDRFRGDEDDRFDE